MSQTNAQLRSLEELDARVDALVDEIGASSAAVQAALPEATGAPASILDDADPDNDAPPPPSAIDPAAGAGPKPAITFDDSDFSSAEAVLQEVSGEIQAQVPVAAPTVTLSSEPVASHAADDTPAIHAADASVARAAVREAQSHESELPILDAALADAADELASAPATPPAAAAVIPPAPPPPEPSLHDQVTQAVAVASDEHPENETSDDAKRASLESAAAEPPVADIEQLDQALAANADKALEDAQRELDDLAAAGDIAESASADPVAPSAPAAPVPQAAASPAVSTAQAPPAPVAAPAPKPAPAPVPEPTVEVLAAEPPAPRRSRIGVLSGALLAPLRPVAALHEKLSEQARQTIAYIAIMNVFFASVVWFFAVQNPVARDPVSQGTHTYHSDEEAAAAKTAAHKAEADHDGHAAETAEPSGHGASDHTADDGHGVKKAETKKAETKKPDARKSTSSKSTKKKSDAKADSHGGH